MRAFLAKRKREKAIFLYVRKLGPQLQTRYGLRGEYIDRYLTLPMTLILMFFGSVSAVWYAHRTMKEVGT